MYEARWDVNQITQWKDKAIYRTRFICSIWLQIGKYDEKQRNEIAKRYGGDMLCATKEDRITNRQIDDAFPTTAKSV